MRAPRCGVPDPVGDSNGALLETRVKRFAKMGSRWKHNDITYTMISYTSDLSKKTVDKIIKKAFNMWSAVTPLTFTLVDNTDADIRISFAKYKHQDQWEFDGKGGTLAHAFGPGSNTHGINGDLDFDDSETFTDKGYSGTDLLFTAVHELGHSLGLSHSEVVGAIMYPWYPGYIKNLQLHPDDIAGIQAIYGTPENPKTVPPPTMAAPDWTPAPTWSSEDEANFPWPNDPQCNVPFGAAANINNEIYGFERNNFWRYFLEDDKFDFMMSAATKAMYRVAPADIDAAYYYDKTNTMRLFKDGSFWDLQRGTKINNPQLISNLGKRMPPKVDAAFYSSTENKAYLFLDDSVWRYDEMIRKVDNGYPKPISVEFPGIGSKVDMAFRGEQDSVYFVTNRVLRQVDLVHRRVTKEPIFLAEAFLPCTRS
ncbi:macrophage metalloelastase-like isoform X2 [Antedon mediterranea]